MTDLQLCIDKNYLEIWSRYEMMFFKVFNSILTDMKYRVWQTEDEWLSFCYERTIQAVNSIKPEKVKHPDTWTIYVQLYRYVYTYASREIEAEKKRCFCSLDAFVEEKGFDENAALHTYDYPEVDMSIFSDEELDFIDFLRSGHKWKEKYSQSTYTKLKESIISKLFD